MTIKPFGKDTAVEKKENQVVEQPTQNVVRSNHRNVDSHEKSPTRLVEVFDDLARSRRSPQKMGARTKCDKRQREREKTTSSNLQYHTLSTLSGNSSQHSYTSGCKSSEHVLPKPGTDQATAINSDTNVENIEETCSGYNSGDEHYQENRLSSNEWKVRDEQFKKMMAERGFTLKDIEEDGACLFRAISLQIYGDEEMHDVIRKQTMDYINANREYFCQYITEDINSYIKRKSKRDAHGNHIEIHAMSELYSRPVELYSYKATPINIFNSEQLKQGYAPLRLSYQRNSHYNAILDPYNATVGVGLGLAGYKPELQTLEAVRLSEQLEIEQTMFEDKLKTTDWEATNEAIEEQVARDSYLQWCRDNEKKKQDGSNSRFASTANMCSSSGVSGNTLSATITSAEAAKTDNIDILNPKNKCNTLTDNTGASSSATSVSSGLSIRANNIESNIDNSMEKVEENSSLLSFSTDKTTEEKFNCDSDDTDTSSTSSFETPNAEKRKNRKAGSVIRRRKIDEEKKEQIEKNHLNDSSQIVKRSKQTPPRRISEPKIDTTSNLNSNNWTTQLSESLASCPFAEVGSLPKTTNSFVNIPGTSKQADLRQPEPVSSFYQSLLESSYAEDGNAQMSENEMLQKAIQMSTIHFIEDQKQRKKDRSTM